MYIGQPYDPSPVAVQSVEDRHPSSLLRQRDFASIGLGRELDGIMANRAFRFVFQPIVDVARSEIFGYEALMRGPPGSPLEAPDTLLDVARASGMLVELESLAALLALEAFGRSGLQGKLFLNFSSPAICGFAADRGSRLFRAAVAAEIAPSRLILELTEHERVEDPEALQQALGIFMAQGIRLALDDFGDGRSSLRLWAQLQPDIVKMDKYFTRGIDRDSRKVDAVRTMMSLAQRFGALLVAEGVEEATELAVLRDLGCGYAQGYLLGRPEAHPVTSLDDAVRAILSSSKIAVLPNALPRPDADLTITRLLVDAPTLSLHGSNEDVRRIFAAHPELHAVAVVDNGYPVGLVNRRTFVERFSRPFQNELFGRRSCTLLMNAEPLRVEGSVLIDSMVRMLAGDDQRYLSEGFVITEGGRYAGIATGESLVRAVTERRIEAARHANPLTLLPGNIPITEHIRRLLEASARFTACYFDLNNFKPFNDLYGYWRGDEMIKLAAQLITHACDPAEDFVGHVGGDDFVVLFQSDDWERRCRSVLTDFKECARTLFDPSDLEREGFESEDRKGVRTFFPLTSIAVGAVIVEGGNYATPESVASAAAAAKKHAKLSGEGFHLRSPVAAPTRPAVP